MRDTFNVHILNADGIAKSKQLQSLFNDFLDALEGTCGVEGREMAVVRTKLQEASFFAKRAMAVDPKNQA